MAIFKAVAVRRAMLAVIPIMAWQVAAKAARDSLFLANFAPSALPSVTAASAVLSVIVAVMSSRFFVRFGPGRVLPAVFLASAAMHVVEALLLPGFPHVAAVLIYLQISSLGSVLISGFWAVAGERFDAREAKRRFGHIAAAGTLASLAGGIMAERVAHWSTTAHLLSLLVVVQLLGLLAFALFARGTRFEAASQQASASLPEVISGAPYLARFAALILLISSAAGLIDYGFKAQAVTYWGRGPVLGQFFALYYAATAVATFLMQAGVSHLWLRRFGPGRTAAVLPLAVTGASTFAILAPGLVTAALARSLEQLLRGSLFRAGYEQLYAPMPQAERRSAKLLIDIGAERTGDGLSAAALQLLINLPAAIAAPVILGIAGLCSAAAAVIALRMDRLYVQMLEAGLAAQSIILPPEEAEDNLTRTILLRTQLSPKSASLGHPFATASAAAPAIADPVIARLAELRSGDTSRIRHVLWSSDLLEPLVAMQVIELLGNEEVARDSAALLRRNANRYSALIAGALSDHENSPGIRQRAARVLGSSDARLAFDALFSQLNDKSFEIRYRCAQALRAIAPKHPEFHPPLETLTEAVQAELAPAAELWRRPDKSNALQVRAAKTGNYLASLLGLILPAEPVRLAFRALQTDDAKLRGIALEYLEGALPQPLASQFAIHLEHGATDRRRSASESLEQLLQSSPAIAARLSHSEAAPANGVPGGL